MSGGQMQRVAIARALVNNPDILLADEPTGALDSETSVQVMELLKTVSKDRLVVMVTHNPELAEEYANRIVRVKDGKIISDTNPYTVDTEQMEPPMHKNMGKSSMSYLTALSLSFNNLRTKLGRTLLTAFAGSIGIIGIALIMSLSTGFQAYIDKIQEDTLSNYPLSIQSETADMGAALAAFGSAMSQAESADAGTVVEQPMITQMFAQIGSNDLASFKAYLEENMSQVEGDINDIKYSYGVKPLIYAADTADGVLQVNPGSLFGDFMGSSALSSYMTSDVFYEMVNNVDLLDSQYDVLQGRWPESYDEMIVVLSNPNQMLDYIAYTLGLKDSSKLQEMIRLVMGGQVPEETDDLLEWTYDDLMALEYSLVSASDKYRYNEEYAVWEDMSNNADHMKALIENGKPLKIVGIVCPKEGVSATTLTPGVAYTTELTKVVIEDASASKIVASQLENTEIDVFTGKSFGDASANQGLNFRDMISIDEEMLTSAFGMNMDQKAVLSLLENYLKNAADSLNIDITPARTDFLDTLSSFTKGMLIDYISQNADQQTGEAVLHLSDAEEMAANYLTTDVAKQKMAELEKKYEMPEGSFEIVYKPLLISMVTAYITTEMPTPEMPEVTIPTLPQIPDATEETVQTTEPVTESADILSEDISTTPSTPDLDVDQIYATITADKVDTVVKGFVENSVVSGVADVMSARMMVTTAKNMLLQKLAGFGDILMRYMGDALNVDENKIASAFQFNMNEEDLLRLMEAMSGKETEYSADANLKQLGYADLDKPTAISVYFVDFASKENFLAFLDGYNAEMEEAGKEDQIIRYTDVTGIMMSSVRMIIDSVSYVLIAFVAVSLVVSSIMIGIITYISVMERTKEIGVLRAIGASKRNISQVFNAETFIIGLCSGVLGVAIIVLLNFPINHIIYSLTENPDIHAQLPILSGVVLILLSMGLTLIGGLIPSNHAARKDPVIALRSE